MKKLFPENLFRRKNSNRGKQKDIFFIGPIGSGTYFHSHEAAANILFHGKKKWFLLPPMSYVGPGAASMQWWVKNLYNVLPVKPIEILQEAGDMLFLPPFWKHATINAGKLVAGVAFQHLGQHNIDFNTYDFSLPDDFKTKTLILPT